MILSIDTEWAIIIKEKNLKSERAKKIENLIVKFQINLWIRTQDQAILPEPGDKKK